MLAGIERFLVFEWHFFGTLAADASGQLLRFSSPPKHATDHSSCKAIEIAVPPTPEKSASRKLAPTPRCEGLLRPCRQLGRWRPSGARAQEKAGGHPFSKGFDFGASEVGLFRDLAVNDL